MRNRWVIRVTTALGVLGGAAAFAGVSLDSLLKEMVDRRAVARFPAPAYTCKQFSSYDRASTDPDDSDTWFANGDYSQFMRVEMNGDRKEWVMLDCAGPGAIVRIWSANPKGVLRVYLDGAETPTIEAPMTDALGGKWKAPTPLSYEASKGWNLYLPIPYAQRCKITSDSDGFYYQINYRTYAPGTPVESFSMAALDAASGNIERVAKEMLLDRTHNPDMVQSQGTADATKGTIKPGDELVLNQPKGANAVSELAISIRAQNVAQALRSCVVVGDFDGETTIWAPVGDFFGVGPGVNAYQDWYRAVGADGDMRCLWMMPYRESGRIAIRNLGSEPVEAQLKTRNESWQWDERSMHFHAVWRQEYPIHAAGGRGTLDFNYVDVHGQGVYVGDVLSVMNPVKEWWGEGDEKIFVDGERFPSHFGTGTEDYYGYAWCCPDVFQRPFHAQPRCDGQQRKCNWGRTTVTRSRSLDAIPFTTELNMNIEVWHWRECDVEYATTAYFYAKPGAKHNRPPLPERAALALVEPPPLPPVKKIAGGVECEGMQVVKKSDGLTVVPQEGWPQIWSEEQQLWVQGKQAGDFVEILAPTELRGPCKLTLYATKSWDYGVIRFSVNGQRVGDDVDLFNGAGRDVASSGPIELGVFEPKDGGFTLRAEVVGANAKSEGTKSYFGLDCVVIETAKPN